MAKRGPDHGLPPRATAEALKDSGGHPEVRGASIRTIALALGLSRTTVSDSLRGSNRVRPETVKLVKAAARHVGYKINPLAAALMSAMRNSRGNQFRRTIAAVNFAEPDRPAHFDQFVRELTAGIHTAAELLGFSVEEILVGPGHLSRQQLDCRLRAKGIRGLVLMPAWQKLDLVELNWSDYAVIFADSMIDRPSLHSVCSDYYRAMMTALDRLDALGYKRPALVQQRRYGERILFAWAAAFRAFQANHPEIERVRPYTYTNPDAGDFARWFEQVQPDVILAHDPGVMQWMEDAGARVPDTHGFLCLNLLESTRPCAGLNLLPANLGRCIAQIIISQLQRDELGIPPCQVTTMVPARWQEGPTLKNKISSTDRPPAGNSAAEATAVELVEVP